MEPTYPNLLAEGVLKLSMVMMIGIYFIFSNTVMTALSRFDNGDQVMVAINREILNPWFLIPFFVSGFGAMYFFISGSLLESAAGAVFFIGTSVITTVFNVPLNDKLDDTPESERRYMWRYYLSKWTVWNHLRTGSALIAGLLLSLS